MSLDHTRDNDNLDMPSSPVAPNSVSDRDSRGEREHEAPLPPPPADVKSTQLTGEARERLEHILGSDIGINTLLNRLKQSVSSARDYSSFLKERALVEEKHASSLKRLARGTHDLVRRPESRGGTYAQCFEESTRVHDRMADNGVQFASSLNHMHDELQETITNIERSRKHWKQTGLEAEKRVADAENAMTKAKGKYNNFAEQYDRARTGEKSGGKFGIKGHKSAAQQEEELHRKMEGADVDYATKVQQAQAARQDLVSTHRPQAIRALQALINECDAALSMQFTKYAGLSEKLLLGNGICVSPLKTQGGAARSLREVAQAVNNEKDFNDYVLSFAAKAGQNPTDIRYEKHPSLSSKQQLPHQPPQPQPPFESGQPPFGTPERTNTGYNDSPYSHGPQGSQSGQVSGVMPTNGDRLSGGPQQPPYGNAPYSQSPASNSPLPQLPPIGGLSLSEPEQRQEAGPGTPTKSPTNKQLEQGQQGRPSMDAYGSGLGQQAKQAGRPSMDPYGPGPHGQPGAYSQSLQQPGVPSGGGYGGPGPRGPPGAQSQSQQLPGVPSGGYSGPGPHGPPGTLPPNQQQPGVPSSGSYGGPGFHPNSRGPSMDAHGPGSRGPSNGQSGQPGLPGVSGAPAYAPQQYQPQSDSKEQPPVPQKGNGVTSPSVTSPTSAAALLPSGQRRTDTSRPNLPPLRPVFGVSLDEIFRRDGSAVPQIVYECVKAVDMYGLETEGIYRTSGSAPNIMQMKAQFDHDSSQVDFRNPASFHHDIASVTTLLKHFLRDLPDPLLTSEAYTQFIQAGKIDDDAIRRDSLHAIINNLPDPNYATLRVLTLHLHRIAQHADKNRMPPSNLAVCLGPTLMGQQPGAPTGQGMDGPDIKDAGWQARVVETILNHTYEIFDDDG